MATSRSRSVSTDRPRPQGAADGAAEVRVHELDGDVALEVGVARAVHGAAGAATELGDEPEAGARGRGLSVDTGDGHHGGGAARGRPERRAQGVRPYARVREVDVDRQHRLEVAERAASIALALRALAEVEVGGRGVAPAAHQRLEVRHGLRVLAALEVDARRARADLVGLGPRRGGRGQLVEPLRGQAWMARGDEGVDLLAELGGREQRHGLAVAGGEASDEIVEPALRRGHGGGDARLVERRDRRSVLGDDERRPADEPQELVDDAKEHRARPPRW
jgi:hypothetical protein